MCLISKFVLLVLETCSLEGGEHASGADLSSWCWGRSGSDSGGSDWEQELQGLEDFEGPLVTSGSSVWGPTEISVGC